MKKLSNFAAICAATLFVSLCFGLVTAGPSTAGSPPQSGPRPLDVRVVNTADQKVPVSISSLPAVQVSSLPAVQVSSLPAVQVSSLPAVQIGNGEANPVPVKAQHETDVLYQSPFEGEIFDGPGGRGFGPFDVSKYDKIRVSTSWVEGGTFSTRVTQFLVSFNHYIGGDPTPGFGGSFVFETLERNVRVEVFAFAACRMYLKVTGR